MDRNRSAEDLLARATRWPRLLWAAPSVISSTVFSKPASISLRSTRLARRRLKSYSSRPRALFAPGTLAVCPTSMIRRNSVRLQVEPLGIWAGGSARPSWDAPYDSSSATARRVADQMRGWQVIGTVNDRLMAEIPEFPGPCLAPRLWFKIDRHEAQAVDRGRNLSLCRECRWRSGRIGQ